MGHSTTRAMIGSMSPTKHFPITVKIITFMINHNKKQTKAFRFFPGMPTTNGSEQLKKIPENANGPECSSAILLFQQRAGVTTSPASAAKPVNNLSVFLKMEKQLTVPPALQNNTSTKHVSIFNFFALINQLLHKNPLSRQQSKKTYCYSIHILKIVSS